MHTCPRSDPEPSPVRYRAVRDESDLHEVAGGVEDVAAPPRPAAEPARAVPVGLAVRAVQQLHVVGAAPVVALHGHTERCY